MPEPTPDQSLTAPSQAWEQARQAKREQRANVLALARIEFAQQLVIAKNAVDGAFQHGDSVMFDAAQEECHRLVDIIRQTRRGLA